MEKAAIFVGKSSAPARFIMVKNRFIWLIISSLALLAVFETLWLRQVWKEQYNDLRQQTDYVFQRTVVALQDSLVQRSMARNNVRLSDVALPRMRTHWNTPGLPPPGATPMQFESKTNLIVRVENKSGDDRFRPDSFRYDKVQVFIATTDSNPTVPGSGMDRLLLNLPQRMHLAGDGEKVFRIEKDTLSNIELEKTYRENLLAASISLPFQLYQADSLPVPITDAGMITQPAYAGILAPRFYTARFSDYNGYLLQQMLPDAAFALLLFGVTAAAFFLIYRSLCEQQRLTQLKNEFISNVTHELKTPITTVGVALEALSDFEALRDPDKTREYLALSKLELDRLSLLVDKVLRLSMFEQQEQRLQPEQLDLVALTRQVIAAMTLQAGRTGAVIHFAALEGEDFSISGDKLHLSSVIFNLLDNALKYGGPAPEIWVALEKTAGTIRLSVQDNGIGIPPEYQARVFDKFFRVPAGDRHDVKGHGLGLSYVAQVLRQHGGTIRVESEAGKGSVFIVELPRYPPA